MFAIIWRFFKAQVAVKLLSLNAPSAEELQKDTGETETIPWVSARDWAKTELICGAPTFDGGRTMKPSQLVSADSVCLCARKRRGNDCFAKCRAG